MSKRLIDANELISAMYYYEHNEGGLTAYDAQDIINKAPTIEPTETFEWCTDCKEYDQEKHCCHRWSKQIRQTVAELEEQYKPKRGEWIEKIVDDVKITVCSNCDKEPTFTHYYGSCGNYSLSDFCPNCGADMREREGE